MTANLLDTLKGSCKEFFDTGIRRAQLLENIHFLISALAFMWIGIMFLGKLIFATIPPRLKGERE